MPGLAGTDTVLDREWLDRIQHGMIHSTFYKHPEEVGQVEVTEENMEDTVDVGEDAECSSIFMEHHYEVLKLIDIMAMTKNRLATCILQFASCNLHLATCILQLAYLKLHLGNCILRIASYKLPLAN